MRTAGISLHDPTVRIRRGEIYVGLFLQFGRAKTRSRSERIFRMAFHECAVGIDRPLQVPFLFGLLSHVEQLLGVAADFFFTRRYVLGLFAGLEDNGGIAEPR